MGHVAREDRGDMLSVLTTHGRQASPVTITAHCTEYYDLRLMKLLMKYIRNIDAASNFLIAIIFGG